MSTPIQKIESIGTAEENNDSQPVKSQAQMDYDEGRGYVERGEAALAAVALHNALRGFEEENNREGVANASNQLGHACLIREEFGKAVIHYKKAWKICEELGDHFSLLSLAKTLAEAHKGAGEYRQALDLCLDLLDSYQKNNDPKNSVEVLEQMAEIYMAAGENLRAADAYKTAASIHANYNHSTKAESLREKAAKLTDSAND
ncbi:MAG: tetratricopeptide repeat protein [Desulfobulbaceae bacterium]|nr:MAG: tetratricopeptide repeat protein [Desulfobulbaceae bacterium]